LKAKRLLVITNSYPDKDDRHTGGIFVKEQVREICGHFEEVHVIYPSMFGIGHRPHEDFQNYQEGNVKVHFMRYFNLPIFLYVARSGFVFFMSRALTKLIKRENIQFDLIHAHFTWPSGRAAVEVKKKTGKPVMITEHTSLTLKRAAERVDPHFLKAWMDCDMLLRNTTTDLDTFRKLGVPHQKLRHMPNGYDESLFTPMDMAGCRRELQLPEDKRIMITVGGLEEVKGHRFLFAALKELAQKRDDLLSVVVGHGPIEVKLKALVKSENLED